MKALLSYGLNFIKHVDCGREVSKEKKNNNNNKHLYRANSM